MSMLWSVKNVRRFEQRSTEYLQLRHRLVNGMNSRKKGFYEKRTNIAMGHYWNDDQVVRIGVKAIAPQVFHYSDVSSRVCIVITSVHLTNRSLRSLSPTTLSSTSACWRRRALICQRCALLGQMSSIGDCIRHGNDKS